MLRCLKLNSCGNSDLKETLSPRPAVDQLARIGLFNGPQQKVILVAEKQLSYLQSINRGIERLELVFASED